ncbi:uncharacterized protein LOC143890708 [Tasmannia lanceolata]|uniref:uncharacterized protein LOC143890708 n=1 Tax=Tasmannia lanceolata TaxID=3420 RepID=UPI0040636A25
MAMDSANSGSIQSSSGGDEEYDSRAESISAFLNSSSQSHLTLQEKGPIATVFFPSPVNPISNPHHQQNPPSFFDSLSNYIDPFPQTPTPPTINSLPNLDPLWSKPLRLDPNCTHIGGLTCSSSSSNPFLTQILPAPIPQTGDTAIFRPSPVATDQINLTRNSKKRSRASRRAPTTVLTTDTSNFRAMVQEFTGIPAPPFSSSPFPRTRLDLFTSHSSPPPYLLRPFPHKPHQPAFVSSENTTNIVSNSTNSTTTPSNFQHQNLLNMQNPIFTFKSLLQTPPKYPNLPAFTAKSQAMDSQLKMGMLEDFTMYQGHANTNINDNPQSWGDGVGSSDGDQSHLKAFNGNYNNSQRVSTCKMNYTVPLSDFNGEKGSENVNSRGEGIVDSWICSSD